MTDATFLNLVSLGGDPAVVEVYGVVLFCFVSLSYKVECTANPDGTYIAGYPE